jgi:serine/threonine-protein kinase
VWSFGVVLYEMLSGRQAFSGETASEILAAVLKTEPEWSVLPASVPPRVGRMLRRCLEKDLRRRVQAIGEARIAIEDALAGAPDETAAVLAGAAPFWRHALPWSLGAALLAFLLGLWAPWRPVPQPEKPQRLSVELGADASLVTDLGTAAVLSPDGSVLAFIARKAASEVQQLYVRRLDQLQAAPLAGTEGARHPFFSSDGEWVAFFASGKLKKVAVTGGAAVTLCEAPDDRGGTWSEEGSILFTPTVQTGLWRVSSAGGEAEALTTPDQAAETSHSWPQALPGGEAVLFTARRAASNLAASNRVANLVVQQLPGGPRKIVHRGGYHGRYLPSGHLVYMHEGTLFAAPFDLHRLETTGPPAPALDGIAWGNGAVQFAFSRRGTLVFVPGVGGAGAVPIQWMDAQGNLTPLRAVSADYRNIRFSPDGRRLGISIVQGRQWDVWIYEWERDTLSRLTFDAGEDYSPVWTPNGQRIAFGSTRADKATLNLYWQRADGTGEAERLTESPNSQNPTSWHPSEKFLAFWEEHPQTALDIMILPLEGDEVSGWKPGKPSVFLNTPFREWFAAFSPDGRWLAYQSNESGTYEVYVRPFPGPGGKWQVSTGGGESPVWSRNGKELFYWSGERIWVASYAVQGDSFRAEKPRAWSPGRVAWRAGFARFDPHPDGKRFAIVAVAEETEVRQDKVVFITNFFDELRRIAPPAKR